MAYIIVFVPLNWQGDLSTFGAYVSRQANFLIDDVGALTNANTEILTVDENLVLDFDKTYDGANSFAGWSDIVFFAIEHGETGDRYVAITNENIWGGIVGLSTLYGTVAVIDVSDEYVEVTAHELGHTWGLLDEYNYIAWQEERDWVLRNMPPSTAYNSYPVDDDPKMPYPPPEYDGPICKGRSFGFLGLGRCTMGYAFRPLWPGYRGFCPECHPIVDDHIFASWGYWSWGLCEVVVTFFNNGTAPEVERITGIPVAGKSMHWAGFGNYSVQVFSEAGGLLYNSNISYSFLLVPSQTEDCTAMPAEIDAITVAWLVPAFSERKITLVLRDNIADQVITSQMVVLAPIAEAWIDYKTTDRTAYDFGDTIEVTTEVETTATSMDIILDVTLLDPNNVAQDYRSWAGTIYPGPDPITQYLTIPGSGIAGAWTVYVVVLNSTGQYQDSETNLIDVGVQYYLDVVVDPATLPPIPGADWYDECTEVKLTAPEYLPSEAGAGGVRYKFSYWDVDGTPVAGNPIDVHMDAPHIATAYYTVQYYLTVKTDPAGIVSIPGEGWHDASTGVSLTAPSVSGYRFLNWDVDGVSQGTGVATITANMNVAHTATAHYQAIPPSASVPTATGTGTATFATDAGYIEDLAAVNEASLPTAGKPSLVFPHGFFSFKVTGLPTASPGYPATVHITVTLPSAVPVGTRWYKWHASVGWISLPIGSDDGDNVITITITDDGIGDFDPTDGVILDPGGPGSPLPVGGVWVPINKFELLAPWISLVSLMAVAAASIVYVKHRKKQQN
jgi:hypothetical protein